MTAFAHEFLEPGRLDFYTIGSGEQLEQRVPPVIRGNAVVSRAGLSLDARHFRRGDSRSALVGNDPADRTAKLLTRAISCKQDNQANRTQIRNDTPRDSERSHRHSAGSVSGNRKVLQFLPENPGVFRNAKPSWSRPGNGNTKPQLSLCALRLEAGVYCSFCEHPRLYFTLRNASS